MKYGYLGFLLFCCLGTLWSQEQYPVGQNVYDDPKGLVYNQEFTVDMKIVTPRNFALGVNIGKLKTFYRTTFLNFEIGDIKHPRERRWTFDYQVPSTNRISRAFIFAKQNNFYVLRGGIGEKRYFSEKAKKKGLAIGMSWEIGPSLGILKPYYLELIRQIDGGPDFSIRAEKYSEANADVFLNINNIYGAASFSEGLDEISLIPGGQAKFALHFDWGAFDEFVKAMEAGIVIDAYPRKVPIVVESENFPEFKNTPLFINLYLNLQLGKRW